MVIDTRVLRLASEQGGVISRRQILALGVQEGAVEGWVERGLLRSVAWGVYLVPGCPFQPLQQVTAAVLRCAPGARAVGPLVLDLLGVEGSRGTDEFGVLTQPGRTVRNVTFPVWEDRMPDRFRARFDRLAIAAGPLAVVEAARFRDGEQLLALVDACRWAGVAAVDAVLALARQLPRHPGAVRIKRLAEDGAFELESPGERSLDAALEGFEPRPERQVWITPRIRVDFLFRDVLLVLEYAGRRHHAGARNRERDAARDDDIRAAGYSVTHIFWEDLADRLALHGRVHAAREVARGRMLALGRGDLL